MKVFTILIFFLLLTPKTTDFCTCPNINDKFINSLKQNSDLIVIGKPIEELVLSYSDLYPIEVVIKFQIDSVLKGEDYLKEIIINQNDAGNCQLGLEINQKYLITGTKVNDIKETYSITQKKHNKKLDSLLKQNYMLLTNGCRSFKLNSNSAKKILNSF